MIDLVGSSNNHLKRAEERIHFTINKLGEMKIKASNRRERAPPLIITIPFPSNSFFTRAIVYIGHEPGHFFTLDYAMFYPPFPRQCC